MDQLTRRLGQVALALLGLVTAVALFSVPALIGAGDRTVTAISDISQCAAAIFAGVMCLRVGPWSTGHAWDRGWRLVGYGMLAWAAGNGVWSYYEIVRQQASPDLSLADIGFLAMVPLVLWGLGRLIGLYRASAIGLIEGLLIACSMFYLSWVAVLGSVLATASDEALQWAVDLAYPVGDAAIASTALILLASASQSGVRLPVALLVVGVLAIDVSDSLYIATSPTYRTGGLVDIGWFLGFLIVGLAGQAARSAPREQPVPIRRRGRGWVALPYVPLAIVALASIGLAATSRSPNIVLSVLLVVMFGLVVVRQMLALSERDALAGDLARSLTTVRQQQDILNQMAYSDPLTGLANRAMFEQRVTADGQPSRGVITAMFIDLDNFKGINDRYGHEVGDAVLVATAQRLRACCRREDTVARVGGDEFVVVAHGLRAAASEQVGHRFLTAMRQPVNVAGAEIPVSASIGTATARAGQIDVHELVRRADAAMYAAKASGHGHYVADPPPVSATPDEPALGPGG